LKILDNQCIVVETADLKAVPSVAISPDWTEIVKQGRKYYFNTKTQVKQWECPLPEPVPLALRKVEVLHAPGYFSGPNNRITFFESYSFLYLETGEELCSEVCAADELVRRRVSKIIAVGDSASRDTSCENVQDMQAMFNALFINVCNACSGMSVEQSIQVSRHIMGNHSAEVIAAVSASPASAAAVKTLQRFANSARIALKVQ
jgi:hypothetical protein